MEGKRGDPRWGTDAWQWSVQVPAGLAEEATCWASGVNRHDREGTGPQTSREDRSPGQWDGCAQLFYRPSSTRVICRGTFKALGLACFSHVLKIGWEASTSLRYFGKFYSAFLQLLSILLSMVLRRIDGTYANSTLPWPLSAMAKDTLKDFSSPPPQLSKKGLGGRCLCLSWQPCPRVPAVSNGTPKSPQDCRTRTEGIPARRCFYLQGRGDAQVHLLQVSKDIPTMVGAALVWSLRGLCYNPIER